MLVGRERELAALHAAVTEVAGGSPAAVLLTGLPGVGKTSLARAALAAADRAGFAELIGRARPLGREMAYAPLAAALGGYLHALPERHRATLVAELPQLSLLFSGLGLQPPAALGDPALEASRLLDGLVRLTGRLARDRPLALLLDDVHQADPATVAFVVQLTAVVSDGPLLLLLTARPDEPGRRDLARLEAALRDSDWRFDRHEVEPLDGPAAAALVSGVLGAGRDPELIARIVARCAGRPLFLEAVARTVAEQLADGVEPTGELPLPDGVRAQLLTRLGGIDEAERTVLELLAVDGGELDYQQLLDASGLAAERLVAALDGLHHRGLVRAGEQTGGHDLAHGLLGDAVLSTLSPIARMRAHARLATVMGADDPRLPEHALAAGALLDPDVALDQLTRGGRHARLVGAPDAAARYLGAAVELAAGQPDVLAQLQRERADSLRRAGHPGEARAAWLVALREYANVNARTEVAAVEQELGMLDWSEGELEAARGHFRAAEQTLDGLPASPAHAGLLHAQLIVASRTGDTDTARRTATRMRELADRLDSPAVEAQACLAEAVLDYAATDYVAMADHNRRGLAAALRADDPLLIIRAHDQLSVAAGSQLDIAALRAHSTASLDVARRLGALVLEGWPRGRLAFADLFAGDWDAALRTTSDMLAIARQYGERRGAVSAAAGHAWVLVHLGRLDDARRHLADARAAAPPMLEQDRNIFSIVALADATLALVEDRPADALGWADQLRLTTGGWLPLFGLALLGEAYARAGEPDQARAIGRRLRGVRSCETVAPTALAGWVDGLAAATDGDTEWASGALTDAAVGFEQLGLPFQAARAGLAVADIASAQQAAVEAAGAALETFERLGAPIQAKAARELLRRLGVVPSRGRARTTRSGGLSSRELEVARLVASGLSNAEVATALFISPRTVTTHLDRIYGRLGLNSRVALTRYLVDSGLLES